MTTPSPGQPPGPAPADPSGDMPTIGVDPGARWTAACLRIGDQARDGWTLGPVDRAGALSPAAMDDMDDWSAFQRYINRLRAALDTMIDNAERTYGAVRIAIETPMTPRGFLQGRPERNRMPLNEWVTPKQITGGIIALYPDILLVHPAKYGRRPLANYPPELIRTRPFGWGPCEARRGERDHERAAFDIAGAVMA